jgi:hypothetical protein
LAHVRGQEQPERGAGHGEARAVLRQSKAGRPLAFIGREEGKQVRHLVRLGVEGHQPHVDLVVGQGAVRPIPRPCSVSSGHARKYAASTGGVNPRSD